MKKYIIFGAGNLGIVLAKELSQTDRVIGFLDNNKDKWGENVEGIKVLGNATVLSEIEYDEIVIASTMRYDEIKKSLVDYGIGEDKINKHIQSRLMVETQARVNFLRDYARSHADSPELCVAEGGVFQGMFAAEINRYFPKNKLYLFDTFEGFHRNDVEVEHKEDYSNVQENYYSETSEEMVLSKMPHKENVIIKKGYFPDTTEDMPEEKYTFVNLDFDLYVPILAGLQYFYPRLDEDGIILIHDYYTEFYHGVRAAVETFEQEVGFKLRKYPIGDGISLAVFKDKGK